MGLFLLIIGAIVLIIIGMSTSKDGEPGCIGGLGIGIFAILSAIAPYLIGIFILIMLIRSCS